MFEIRKLSKIPLCRILPIPTKNLCLHGVATAENKSSTCSPPACNALNLKVQLSSTGRQSSGEIKGDRVDRAQVGGDDGGELWYHGASGG